MEIEMVSGSNAFDLVQTFFSHQPVFRGLQIKQGDPYLANFLSGVTVDGCTRPFC